MARWGKATTIILGIILYNLDLDPAAQCGTIGPYANHAVNNFTLTPTSLLLQAHTIDRLSTHTEAHSVTEARSARCLG